MLKSLLYIFIYLILEILGVSKICYWVFVDSSDFLTFKKTYQEIEKWHL